jgi:hypothetical protein
MELKNIEGEAENIKEELPPGKPSLELSPSQEKLISVQSVRCSIVTKPHKKKETKFDSTTYFHINQKT